MLYMASELNSYETLVKPTKLRKMFHPHIENMNKHIDWPSVKADRFGNSSTEENTDLSQSSMSVHTSHL